MQAILTTTKATQRLITELVRYNRKFHFMAYPNSS